MLDKLRDRDRLTVFSEDDEEVAEIDGFCSVRATFRPPLRMSESASLCSSDVRLYKRTPVRLR